LPVGHAALAAIARRAQPSDSQARSRAPHE
jgi:hypothetical protein